MRSWRWGAREECNAEMCMCVWNPQRKMVSVQTNEQFISLCAREVAQCGWLGTQSRVQRTWTESFHILSFSHGGMRPRLVFYTFLQ